MYEARGVPEGPDDGTLAPGAVVASLPFAPELVTDTLREVVRAYPGLRSEYGLRASLNPTFGDWISPLNYGLDQGPIVMMIENHRTGLPWNLMRRFPTSGADCGRRVSPADGSNQNANRNARAAVEGRWRERGTPFSKLVEGTTDGERSHPHPTATMRAARIHSYGDPTGSKSCRLRDPSRGSGRFWSA